MRRRCSLLLGALIAVLLAGAQARAAEPARLVLKVETAADGTVRVLATVTDKSGAPVAEAPVTFRARTAFGWLTLVETTTGPDGRARTILSAPIRGGEISAETGEEELIRATILAGEVPAFVPQIRPGHERLRSLSPQPGFISPYPVPLQLALFGLVLGGIWTTYGYVVWLLLRIRRGH